MRQTTAQASPTVLIAALAQELRTSGAPANDARFVAMVIIRAANTAGVKVDRNWFLTACGL